MSNVIGRSAVSLDSSSSIAAPISSVISDLAIQRLIEGTKEAGSESPSDGSQSWWGDSEKSSDSWWGEQASNNHVDSFETFTSQLTKANTKNDFLQISKNLKEDLLKSNEQTNSAI